MTHYSLSLRARELLAVSREYSRWFGTPGFPIYCPYSEQAVLRPLMCLAKSQVFCVISQYLALPLRTNGRIWIPKLAKFSVAVNPVILRYLKQMAERE